LVCAELLFHIGIRDTRRTETKEDRVQKDPRIIGALHHLESALGRDSFVVTDHWEADLLAVGVANPSNPDALAYIAVEGAAGQFTVIIEGLPKPGSDMPYEDIGRFQCKDLDDVTWVVQDFLAIQPSPKP
jgi:hypothetical protein